MGSGDTDGYTDLVILRDSIEDKALLMGSSITGALRNYLREVQNGYNATETSLLFGGDRNDNDGEQSPLIINDALSSEFIKAELRDIVDESIIKETNDLIQTRIAIDRFTGGALHSALFQEQPIFASDQTEIALKLELRQPEKHEIGLLLLLLKDLWTGDLPVGSTSSIGRLLHHSTFVVD